MLPFQVLPSLISNQYLNLHFFFSKIEVLVDQLVDCIAHNCSELERLELRWDAETLRYSDKSQKAIDMLRVRCLRLHCLVLRLVHHYHGYLKKYLHYFQSLRAIGDSLKDLD